MDPSARALDLLSAWPAWAERYWSEIPGRPDLGCFGTGYNSWGVQTNQKYLAALGVLATDPAFASPGFSREQALERALRALRFSLASHHTGNAACTDGTPWGRTWISVLGVERMMHAMEDLDERLSDADRAALRRVLVDEADHQLKAQVVAGLWGQSGKNKPESNIWNGAVCARAALLYPDEPHAGEWLERARDYWINGISVPADAEDSTPAGGRTVRERHRGANFFPHFSLDHHAYLNVGYMVISISNIAMVHYAYERRGRKAPPELYHHARELWALIRRLVLPDGRLLRIGGDSRLRYCYCQDYLLPALCFAADYWRDPLAQPLLAAQLELIARERDANGDGSFHSRRLAHLAASNTNYYTRLESDKAVALSFVRSWLRRRALPAAAPAPAGDLEGGWEEPEHGAAFHRSATRVASWAWRAAEGPMGLCLPPRGDLAEWSANLSGAVRFAGEEFPSGPARAERDDPARERRIVSFPGGFLAHGRVRHRVQVRWQEGFRAEWEAPHRVVFAALPDGHTVVRLERARVPAARVYLQALEGVKLEIPNDLLNGERRTYAGAFGARVLAAHVGAPELLALGSPWLNVDDVLGLVGLYGAPEWAILRRGQRIGGPPASILTDALLYPGRMGLWDVQGPAEVLDSACVLLASVSAAATRAFHAAGRARRLTCDVGARAVLVQGQDGREYLLVAHADAVARGVEVQTPPALSAARWEDLSGGEVLPAGPALRVELAPEGARLFVAQT